MGVPGGGESVGRNQDHLNISWGHTRAFPVANTHLHTTNTLPDIDMYFNFFYVEIVFMSNGILLISSSICRHLI